MPNYISLSDFVLNRVRCLVSFRILLRELNSDLWLCVPQGFDPRCGPARPARPWHPLLPMHAPPGPFSLISIVPRNNLSLSPPVVP
jgi:hypothetical protein